MTETTTLDAAQIIERNRIERETLRAHYREQAVETRRWQAERLESLPTASYEPVDVVVPGVAYVLADRKITARDPRTNTEFVAALPHRWIPEEYARRIGLDGEAVILRPGTPPVPVSGAELRRAHQRVFGK